MESSSKIKKVGLFTGPLVFLLFMFFDEPNGMSPEAWKVAAVTFWMAIWWITEAVPIPATALLPIVLYPALGVMKTAAAAAEYANPTIYLFMGGFFIAVTMERWNLHKRIALYTIKFVGSSPNRIVLGFMISTAFLSMWVSNTATAMMMVPIGIAVITQITGHTTAQMASGEVGSKEHNFGIGLMLAIAYSASIGGISTIIGTPPNTIMVGMMNSMYGVNISFAQWLIFGLPLALVMLFIIYIVLTQILFRTKGLKLVEGPHVIHDEIKKLGKISHQEKAILCVFILVATLWIAGSFIPTKIKGFMDDTTVALFGTLLLFVIPANWKRGEFLLNWKTAVKIPWDIVLLFGGGFAVAKGFQATKLAEWVSLQLISLDGLSIVLFIGISTLLVVFLTEITSNTATATLLVPIMGASAIAMGIHPFATIISACVAASFAFMLPVATPPNAVVFGSGAVRIADMAKAGIWLNIIGTIVIVIFVVYVLPVLWGVDLNSVPEWALKTVTTPIVK